MAFIAKSRRVSGGDTEVSVSGTFPEEPTGAKTYIVDSNIYEYRDGGYFALGVAEEVITLASFGLETINPQTQSALVVGSGQSNMLAQAAYPISTKVLPGVRIWDGSAWVPGYQTVETVDSSLMYRVTETLSDRYPGLQINLLWNDDTARSSSSGFNVHEGTWGDEGRLVVGSSGYRFFNNALIPAAQALIDEGKSLLYFHAHWMGELDATDLRRALTWRYNLLGRHANWWGLKEEIDLLLGIDSPIIIIQMASDTGSASLKNATDLRIEQETTAMEDPQVVLIDPTGQPLDPDGETYTDVAHTAIASLVVDGMEALRLEDISALTLPLQDRLPDYGQSVNGTGFLEAFPNGWILATRKPYTAHPIPIVRKDRTPIDYDSTGFLPVDAVFARFQPANGPTFKLIENNFTTTRVNNRLCIRANGVEEPVRPRQSFSERVVDPIVATSQITFALVTHFCEGAPQSSYSVSVRTNGALGTSAGNLVEVKKTPADKLEVAVSRTDNSKWTPVSNDITGNEWHLITIQISLSEVIVRLDGAEVGREDLTANPYPTIGETRIAVPNRTGQHCPFSLIGLWWDADVPADVAALDAQIMTTLQVT